MHHTLGSSLLRSSLLSAQNYHAQAQQQAKRDDGRRLGNRRRVVADTDNPVNAAEAGELDIVDRRQAAAGKRVGLAACRAVVQGVVSVSDRPADKIRDS